jgi:hypothetical protein
VPENQGMASHMANYIIWLLEKILVGIEWLYGYNMANGYSHMANSHLYIYVV